MTSLLAIANAEAGAADDTAVEAAVDALRDDFDVDLVRTSSPDDLSAALSAHPDVDVLVVLGGDGSLHAVVTALHRAERLDSVTVGLIPLGTGNDFAATLGLPDEPDKAALAVVTGHTRQIDLILDDEGDVVVNAAHIGIGAEAAAAARPWKKALGPVGYAIGAALTGLKGLTTPGARLTISVDGKPLSRKNPVIQVAVGNGRFVGGGAPLLPQADPSDGELDVSVSYTESPLRRIAYAFSVRRGEHHRRDDVIYLRGTEVEVRGDALRCTSDGELTAPSTHYRWTLLPSAMTVFVP
ncbi:YegS/Rv2252/BmrU family lipid kinase [Aeromicrobium sp. SMF47]|uniref:diacylglycerol/lipid kinase family protein n=1 Tax=Aeromicrobium TaxID=2040 RepID=UPI00129E3F66|nr:MULTISPECIES: YegS/Rv2252/BmrU family lipid kinase [Aeromicrobium]MRJ75324.1 YegS/Rv2252/BmrU family lipid kinase [Aeromicrobium yanjiei]MRK02617.1 YegS/Rv2252/BmrU family lipid kinase [Aeromicrobium sp. S22]